jgi:hypothetical protein
MHRYPAIELNGVIDYGEILNPLVKSLKHECRSWKQQGFREYMVQMFGTRTMCDK